MGEERAREKREKGKKAREEKEKEEQPQGRGFLISSPTLYHAGFCMQNPAWGWLFCKADVRSGKDEDIKRPCRRYLQGSG